MSGYASFFLAGHGAHLFMTMKIDPGFLNHWKTEMLIERAGAEAVLAVLRLWGNAQIQREYQHLALNPKRLAMQTKWTGDPEILWAALTDPDSPWLDAEQDGTYSIHGYADHQHQLVRLWDIGKSGGRPKKVSPTPSSKKEESLHSDNTNTSIPYPICEPYENHMVSNPTQMVRRPTLDQAKSAGNTMGIAESMADEWWHAREATDWKKGTAAGGTVSVGANWQADLKTYASRMAASPPRTATGRPDHRAEKRAREYPEPRKRLPLL